VNLAIIAEIEAHHQAVIIYPLSVDDVRCDTRGLIDRRESGTRVTRKYETGSIVCGGKLADDIALVVDAEGVGRTGWGYESLRRAAIGEEEGVRAVPAYHIAGAVDPERDLAGAGV